jgi:cytochrome c556
MRSVIIIFTALLWLADGPAAAEPPALPDSLTRWYKPLNERQVWLHTMFSLRRELQAVQEYAAAGDTRHLAKWAARLTEHYRSIGDMVPEWADELETGDADALTQAAADGDTAAVTAAARRLARSCRSCHREFRALAAARFRAPDFSQIATRHNGSSQTYAEAMEELSRSVNRIKIRGEDADWDGAAAALRELGARLDSLGDSCAACHDDAPPRERILGQGTRDTLTRLQGALEQHDPRQTGRWLGSVAVQVCARCHGVHRTLSDLKDRLLDD